MINRTRVLADLQMVLRRLETDLLERSEEMAPVKGGLLYVEGGSEGKDTKARMRECFLHLSVRRGSEEKGGSAL